MKMADLPVRVIHKVGGVADSVEDTDSMEQLNMERFDKKINRRKELTPTAIAILREYEAKRLAAAAEHNRERARLWARTHKEERAIASKNYRAKLRRINKQATTASKGAKS